MRAASRSAGSRFSRLLQLELGEEGERGEGRGEKEEREAERREGGREEERGRWRGGEGRRGVNQHTTSHYYTTTFHTHAVTMVRESTTCVLKITALSFGLPVHCHVCVHTSATMEG